MSRHAAGIRTGRHISVKARGGGVQCLRSALPWQLITFIPSRGIGTPITGVLIAFERYPSREGGTGGESKYVNYQAGQSPCKLLMRFSPTVRNLLS